MIWRAEYTWNIDHQSALLWSLAIPYKKEHCSFIDAKARNVRRVCRPKVTLSRWIWNKVRAQWWMPKLFDFSSHDLLELSSGRRSWNQKKQTKEDKSANTKQAFVQQNHCDQHACRRNQFQSLNQKHQTCLGLASFEKGYPQKWSYGRAAQVDSAQTQNWQLQRLLGKCCFKIEALPELSRIPDGKGQRNITWNCVRHNIKVIPSPSQVMHIFFLQQWLSYT